MKKESNDEIIVKCYYNNDGKDIVQLLTDSVLLFIGNEVQKFCC